MGGGNRNRANAGQEIIAKALFAGNEKKIQTNINDKQKCFFHVQKQLNLVLKNRNSYSFKKTEPELQTNKPDELLKNSTLFPSSSSKFN